MSDFGRRATPTGNFNGWISNLLSALYTGENFATSYNQYTNIVRDFRHSHLDRINASVTLREFLDEHAITIAGAISEMGSSSNTNVTDMLRETIAIIPKLKKFNISGPKIDGYISLLNPNNPIYKPPFWKECVNLLCGYGNSLSLVVNFCKENFEYISMKSLDAAISIVEYMTFDKNTIKSDKYFDIISETIEMFIDMLKKDNSPAYKTNNNRYLKSSLKTVLRICSKSNSAFDELVYPTLQNLALDCFKCEKLEKAKFGIVLLTALFESSAKIESIDPNEIFSILLDKDIHNSVVSEITPLFVKFADSNLITPTHLDKIWERCLSVHTSQKDTYLTILENTLLAVPKDQFIDFFQEKITNAVDDPLIITLCIRMMSAEKKGDYIASLFEKQLNQIDDPSTISFVEQELESSKKINIFEKLATNALEDFISWPNEFNCFLMYMGFKNLRNNLGKIAIPLSELCKCIQKADLQSNTGNKLLKAYLSKFTQKLSKEDVEVLLQTRNNKIWDLFLKLIEEHGMDNFDISSIQYLYQYSIQQHLNTVSFVKVFYYVTILNGINDDTIQCSNTTIDKKALTDYTPISLNIHFNIEMKSIISDQEYYSKPVRDAALVCLTTFWNNSFDNVYKTVIKSLFREMIDDPSSRLMSLELLKRLTNLRVSFSIKAGYCRHTECINYTSNFLKLNIYSRTEYISFKNGVDFEYIASLIKSQFGFYGQTVELTKENHVAIPPKTLFASSGIKNGDLIIVKLNGQKLDTIPQLTPPFLLSHSSSLDAATKIIELIESGECSNEEILMLRDLLNGMPNDPKITKLIREDVSKFVEGLRNSDGLLYQYELECLVPLSYYPDVIYEFVVCGGIQLIIEKNAVMNSKDKGFNKATALIIQNSSIVPEFNKYQEDLLPLLFNMFNVVSMSKTVTSILQSCFDEDNIFNYIESNTSQFIEMISNMTFDGVKNILPLFNRYYPNLSDAVLLHLHGQESNYSNFAVLFVKLCEFPQNDKIELYFHTCISILQDHPELSSNISLSLAKIIDRFQPAELELYIKELLDICSDKKYADARPALYKKFAKLGCDSTIENDIANFICNLTRETAHGRYKYNPMSNKRNSYGVGLKNLGATCYLNSTIQMAHSIKEFTNMIVQESFESESMQNLQKLIASLELTSKKYVEPDPFVYSFMMYGSIKIAVNEQQDASEFWSSLLDQLPSNIQKLFGIQSVSIINGLSSDFKKELIDTSPLLGVTVQGCKTLYESLDRLMEKEIFTGDNKYKSEELGKIDAFRFNRIRSFPPVLWIHLKRFDFNVEQCRYEKVNSRLEFPLDEIDVSKYMEDPLDRLIYQFHGAIIHRGDGIGGHYISIVKRNNDYIKFDDTEASKISEDEFIKIAYGELKKGATRDSAYILVYRQKCEDATRFEDICPKNILEEIDCENSMFDREANLFNEDMCSLATKFCNFEQYLEYVLRVFCHSVMKETSVVESRLLELLRQIGDMSSAYEIVMKHFSEICEVIVDCPEKQLYSIVISLLRTVIKGINIVKVPNLISEFAKKLKENVNYNKAIDDFGMLIYECMSVNKGAVGKRVTNLDNFGLIEALYDVMIYFFNDSTKPLRLESLNMSYLFKIIKLMASHKFRSEYNKFMNFGEYVAKNPNHLTDYKEMKEAIIISRKSIPIDTILDSAKSQDEIELMVNECNDDKLNSLLKKLTDDFEVNPSVNYSRLTKGARMLIINPLSEKVKASAIAFRLAAMALPSSKILLSSLKDSEVQYQEETTDEMRALASALKSAVIKALKEKEPRNSIPSQRYYFTLFKALFIDFPDLCRDEVRLIDVLRYIDFIKDQASLKGYLSDVASVIGTFSDEIDVVDVMKYKHVPQNAYPVYQQMFMIMFNAARHGVRLEVVKRSETMEYCNQIRHYNLGSSPNISIFLHNLMDLWDYDGSVEAGKYFCGFYTGCSYSNDYLNQTIPDYIRAFKKAPEKLQHRYMRFICDMTEKKNENYLKLLLKTVNECENPPVITTSVLEYATKEFMDDETVKMFKIFILRSMESQMVLVDKIKKMNSKKLSPLICHYYINENKKKEFLDVFSEQMNYTDTLQSMMDSDFPQIPMEWLPDVAKLFPKVFLNNKVALKFWREVFSKLDENTKEEVLGEFVRKRLKGYDDKISINSCGLLHDLRVASKQEVINIVDAYCEVDKNSLHDLIELCFK